MKCYKSKSDAEPVEARDPLRGLFGDAPVEELTAHRDLREAGLLHQLLGQMRRFEAGSPQSDEVAAILLKLETG